MAVVAFPPYIETDHPQSTLALHSPPVAAFASNARHSLSRKHKLANRPKNNENQHLEAKKMCKISGTKYLLVRECSSASDSNSFLNYKKRPEHALETFCQTHEKKTLKLFI